MTTKTGFKEVTDVPPLPPLKKPTLKESLIKTNKSLYSLLIAYETGKDTNIKNLLTAIKNKEDAIKSEDSTLYEIELKDEKSQLEQILKTKITQENKKKMDNFITAFNALKPDSIFSSQILPGVDLLNCDDFEFLKFQKVNQNTFKVTSTTNPKSSVTIDINKRPFIVNLLKTIFSMHNEAKNDFLGQNKKLLSDLFSLDTIENNSSTLATLYNELQNLVPCMKYSANSTTFQEPLLKLDENLKECLENNCVRFHIVSDKLRIHYEYGLPKKSWARDISRNTPTTLFLKDFLEVVQMCKEQYYKDKKES